MKRLITILLLSCTFYCDAQLYTGTGGIILNNGANTYFNMNVSGLSPATLDTTFGVETVSINITHPAVQELFIYLQSPSGTVVELTNGSSCSGANYTNTNFNNSDTFSITTRTAPFSGNFRPVGNLGRFNNGQNGNGTWKLIVHDYLAFVDSGNVVNWSITFGTSPPHPVNFVSSNLPIVIINTYGQTIGDIKQVVSMGIVDNGPGMRNHVYDPLNNYDAKAAIKLRGNSTRDFEKKSYSFETRDASNNQIDVSILGMPIENDWELVAPYQDKTLIRIPLTYDLARETGHYAPRFKDVEVVLNNEYQGVYAMMEKVKRDTNRVHVSKLANTDNTYPTITGGYIIKIDRSDSPGWTSLYPGDSPTASHFYYQYIYPKDSDISVPQAAYIKSSLDSFGLALHSSYFADPYTGYRKYIDVGSFIDYFIINELSKNVDAYRLSTFLSKDRITKGGKIHIGPVWDYDIAWHNCNYGNTTDPTGWQYQLADSVHPTPEWWGRFMLDSNFVNQLYCRWNYLRQNILSYSSINAYVDSSASVLAESEQRNFIQWPIIGAYIYPDPQSQVNASYAGEITDLKNWINNRIGWMDYAITGHCSSITGIHENDPENNIVFYPNPMGSSATFSLQLAERADVSIIVTDALGKEVSRFLEDNAPPGETKIPFDRNNISPGIYFYQAQIHDHIKMGKIIVQ
ncbi:MAG: CotH kinase family protein [Bacteroidia bacterium]